MKEALLFFVSHNRACRSSHPPPVGVRVDDEALDEGPDGDQEKAAAEARDERDDELRRAPAVVARVEVVDAEAAVRRKKAEPLFTEALLFFLRMEVPRIELGSKGRRRRNLHA